jgi:hypothetical protein
MTLFEALNQLKAALGTEAQRVVDAFGRERSLALSQFLRPNLPPAPTPVRRLAEPIVAACALLALLVLGGIGLGSLLGLMLAAVATYAIITKVFGIELELGLPHPQP